MFVLSSRTSSSVALCDSSDGLVSEVSLVSVEVASEGLVVSSDDAFVSSDASVAEVSVVLSSALADVASVVFCESSATTVSSVDEASVLFLDFVL